METQVSINMPLKGHPWTLARELRTNTMPPNQRNLHFENKYNKEPRSKMRDGKSEI
jgi:hypothetical protein